MPAPYQIVRRLGENPSLAVDLAVDSDEVDVTLSRIVLGGTPEDQAEARARLRREGRLVGAVGHHGIGRIMEVLEVENGLIVVQPHLPGGNLSGRILRDGPMSPEQVQALTEALVPALAAAHRAGVIHRDLTPDKIRFDAHDRPVIADFGIARAREAIRGAQIAVTAYAAPERRAGGPATAAADVWSLGATLLHAATGRPPTPETGPDAVPGDLPRPLRRQLGQMLDPDPARRINLASLEEDVELTDEQRKKRRRRLVSGTIFAVLLAVGLAAAAIGRAERQDEAAGKAAPKCPDGRSAEETEGCEGTPDALDGRPLHEGPYTANVHLDSANRPPDPIDRYPLLIGSGSPFPCDQELSIVVNAPADAAIGLQLLRPNGTQDGDTARASDGGRAWLTIQRPAGLCGPEGAVTITAQVSVLHGDPGYSPYRIEATAERPG